MVARLRSGPSRLATSDSRKVRPAPKVRAAVYGTPAYAEWRGRVIGRAAGACQGADHDPARPRTGVRLFADHVVELRDGGAPFDPANGMALCGACHTRKTVAARVRRLKR